jgi:hypothetical protein
MNEQSVPVPEELSLQETATMLAEVRNHLLKFQRVLKDRRRN